MIAEEELLHELDGKIPFNLNTRAYVCPIGPFEIPAPTVFAPNIDTFGHFF